MLSWMWTHEIYQKIFQKKHFQKSTEMGTIDTKIDLDGGSGPYELMKLKLKN